MSDHDGHTINIGVPDRIGPDPIVTDDIRDEINGAEFWQMRAWVEDLLPEVDRLRDENTALAAALEDIAGMRELPDGTWIADAECMNMRRRCWEYLGKPDGGPEEWCPVCVAEVAWCAWKMGVLG